MERDSYIVWDGQPLTRTHGPDEIPIVAGWLAALGLAIVAPVVSWRVAGSRRPAVSP